jgi:hypothetical protein
MGTRIPSTHTENYLSDFSYGKPDRHHLPDYYKGEEMKNFAMFMTVALLLTGCATPEYNAARQTCEFISLKQLPPIYQQKIVNRTRTETVPNGTRTCTKYRIEKPCKGKNCISRIKIKTVCKDGTKRISVPYSEKITIDINKIPRNRATDICAKNKCIKTFGNQECKKN